MSEQTHYPNESALNVPNDPATTDESPAGDPAAPGDTPPAAPGSPATPPADDNPNELTPDPDFDLDPDDDGQQAPPIAQAFRTPEQMEAAIASWDREKSRHMRELEKRDDVRFNDTVECPLCEGHGRIWPVLPEPEQSARREFILGALGGTPEADYRPHPSEIMCDQCDGWGKVYTGSRVPNQDLLNCPACGGSGHRAGSSHTPAPGYPAAPAAAGGGGDYQLPYSTVPPAEQYRIGNDAFGRPPGDPHYGVPPMSGNAAPLYAGQP